MLGKRRTNGDRRKALKTEIAGVIFTVDIAKVDLVSGLENNLFSYVPLEGKGVRLIYESMTHYPVPVPHVPWSWSPKLLNYLRTDCRARKRY
jgi:hypothetical protein